MIMNTTMQKMKKNLNLVIMMVMIFMVSMRSFYKDPALSNKTAHIFAAPPETFCLRNCSPFHFLTRHHK